MGLKIRSQDMIAIVSLMIFKIVFKFYVLKKLFPINPKK